MALRSVGPRPEVEAERREDPKRLTDSQRVEVGRVTIVNPLLRRALQATCDLGHELQVRWDGMSLVVEVEVTKP